MPIPTNRFLTGVLLMVLMPGGCSVYQKYGHGSIVKSKRDSTLQTPVVLPANAPSISQRFNPRTGPSNNDHRGFDILVPTRTPVLAAADGVVSQVRLSLLYGKQVMLDHDRGSGGFRLQTRYFHLTEQRVRAGESVRRGQLLGYSGMTGLAGMFPHLHFEVHKLNDADPAVASGFQDPQLFWVDGVGRVNCYDRTRAYPQTPAMLTYPVPCLGLEWQAP